MFDRLNWGCGGLLLPGYINLDVDVHGPSAIGLHRDACMFWQADATQPWPFGNGAIAEVRADQFIEHLTLEQMAHFIAEAHRVLCIGGELRLSFPDISAIAESAARGELDAVADQEGCSRSGVPKGLGVLNHMQHGWGHQAILTTALVEQMVAQSFRVVWRAIVWTNGLVIASKAA